MNDWAVIYEGFDPEQESLREALCTLGNGYFATRGAGEETRADGTHYPGTYLAGGYNRVGSGIAGRVIYNEDLVNFPNWLPLTFRPADGRWLNIAGMRVLDYRQELNLRLGLLLRRMRVRDRAGRETTVETRRFVHMDQRHYAAVEVSFRPENWSGRVDVRSLLDGSVINYGVDRYRALNSKHLEVVEKGEVGEDGVFLLVRTNQSRVEMAQAARTRLYRGAERLSVERRRIDEPELIGHYLSLDVEQGACVTAEKIAALYTSRDAAISEAAFEAREAVERAGRFEELLESHTRAWSALWHRCDVEVEPGGEEQLAIRFHVFHLLQTASPNTIDLDCGLPARGLHGEAYRGHIFWDQLYVFPFFNLRLPEVTRSALRYRYQRLDMARRLAHKAGFAGAMFPWQSGSNGQEETQEVHLNPRTGEWGPDYSRNQRHVNLALAYNVWSYCNTSDDWDFMEAYGAELILEITRLFASLCRLNPDTGRYEIHGVMGPDEYHEKYPDSDEPGLWNNAYTNVMVVWLMKRAAEVLERIGPERRMEIVNRIGLHDSEVEQWDDVTRRMTVPFHDGVISQFEGYERLDEFDWEGYRAKYGDIHRLDRILKAEGDSPDHYRVSKQADVLMLLYLLPAEEVESILAGLGYRFDERALRDTVDYYLQRTSHGSTLSLIVHAAVLDLVGDRRGAWELFRQALDADLRDVQGGTTAEGIHLGVMAGTVDIVLQSFAGIDTSRETLQVHPHLPDAFTGIRLRLQHRRRWYELWVERDRCRLQLIDDGRGPAVVQLAGTATTLQPGQSCERRFAEGPRDQPVASGGPK